MTDSSLFTTARRQHGLVTRGQALEVMSANTLDRRVRARRLEPVRRGVHRVAGAPETWDQQLLAACLAGGADVYASFQAAGAVHALAGSQAGPLDITRFGGRPPEIAGVRAHASEVFDAAHLARVRAVPVTSVARTPCDLTAMEPSGVVERAVGDALRREIVSLTALRRVASHLEGRGRHRCTVMRDILEDRIPGYHPAESEPERRVADLLVRAGLPEPVRQRWVEVGSRRYRVDLCYPELGIAIEYDGWDHHQGRQAFDADRARGNDLVVLGLTLLRFTSKSSDQTIVDTVHAAIERASRS
jgi:very-short-patch-repair endonuclease